MLVPARLEKQFQSCFRGSMAHLATGRIFEVG